MKALLLPILFALGAAGAARAAEQPARSRLCPEDLPEGVRLPPQPGCAAGTRPAPTRREGVYDLGDGTTVRIGGHASATYGVRR
ncbi:hypothetical protein [Methylobacterium sp. E-065]|uniref:hypothetical protein n=1 Tax=unclassified Methylobacterium TaxID=2615210 RepID=UPI001FBB0806|nr:hypothetical protein [Methylobacterium sp. E-065]MCJ2021110.1 hypothetical protein [Methylobacterium sp. E-065]